MGGRVIEFKVEQVHNTGEIGLSHPTHHTSPQWTNWKLVFNCFSLFSEMSCGSLELKCKGLHYTHCESLPAN